VAKGSAEVGSTANRYQILGKLAVGGMAEIFLARGANTTGLVRYCVLKRILRERATDAQFVQMFLDEAKLAAQLQHPSIASVYDIGMLGDSYFFTMEYVHGETVRSLLQRAKQRDRKVPMACVLTIIAGAAAGLHHAHERNGNDGRPLGIVHRDISPANLMVSYEGNLKIVDFGVAKAADRVETKSGTVKGKISYLSPEQCRGTRVDRRSDLFSLGIVMWEILTGDRLYRRSSDFENMTAIVHEPPPPPSSRRPDVPRAIDDIVLRLLAKSVADRYQTAGEVVEALENASMRAGTILSTSALSRLVHDLFGTRPEPWLDLDTETAPLPRMLLASRPLPRNLAAVPLDPVEAELAAVPDLSVSMVLDDEFDDGGPDEAATEPPRPAPSRRDAAALALGSIAPPVDAGAAPRRAPSSPPWSPSPPAAPPPVLAIAPPTSRAPATVPLAGAAPSAQFTVPGSRRAAAAPAPEPAPPSPPASARPSQPVLPSGGVRALLEAVASAVPANTPSATTLLGHSAPAVNAALIAMRQTASALASGQATTTRDAATAASSMVTTPDLQPAGASAMTPGGSEPPTRVTAPSIPTITPTQRVAPWPQTAAPSGPFEPPPRFAAPSAPNPILDSAPQRPGFAAPARPPQPPIAGVIVTDDHRTPRRGSRFTLTLLAIVVIAAAVGASIAWFSMRDDRDPGAPGAAGSASASPGAPAAVPEATGAAAAAPPAQPAGSSGPAAIAGSGTAPSPPEPTGSAAATGSGTAAPPDPDPSGSSAPAPAPAPPSPAPAPPSPGAAPPSH
jgi:serine/threonine-protein kinase